MYGSYTTTQALLGSLNWAATYPVRCMKEIDLNVQC